MEYENVLTLSHRAIHSLTLVLLIRSPHLGTDNLVRLLRNMRADLKSMGGEIHFGAR
jgi:uncharacterized FAD-dependent dehydrogenase